MTSETTISRDGAHDPRAIANYIFERNQVSGKPVTMMQLIKLVYIADGWSLALLGKPLSKHNPQAWQYGPVYPVLYTALKRYGSRPIDAPVALPGTEVAYASAFSEDERRLMDMVADSYGKLSAFTLSNLTHQAGTPWSAAHARGRYSEISAAEMKSHFSDLKAKRLVHAAT